MCQCDRVFICITMAVWYIYIHQRLVLIHDINLSWLSVSSKSCLVKVINGTILFAFSYKYVCVKQWKHVVLRTYQHQWYLVLFNICTVLCFTAWNHKFYSLVSQQKSATQFKKKKGMHTFFNFGGLQFH